MSDTLRKTPTIWAREQCSQDHESINNFKSKKPSRELTKEEQANFGDLLSIYTSEKDLLLGWLNIHYLSISRKAENDFDLSNLMNNKSFGQIGLADTGRHWPSLPEEYRIHQILRDQFISQQLDSTTALNRHDYLSFPYQHRGSSSITSKNLIISRVELGRDN